MELLPSPLHEAPPTANLILNVARPKSPLQAVASKVVVQELGKAIILMRRTDDGRVVKNGADSITVLLV